MNHTGHGGAEAAEGGKTSRFMFCSTCRIGLPMPANGDLTANNVYCKICNYQVMLLIRLVLSLSEFIFHFISGSERSEQRHQQGAHCLPILLHVRPFSLILLAFWT